MAVAGIVCVVSGNTQAVTAYTLTTAILLSIVSVGGVVSCWSTEARDLRDIYKEERAMYKEKIAELESRLESVEITREKEIILRKNGNQKQSNTESRIAIGSSVE